MLPTLTYCLGVPLQQKAISRDWTMDKLPTPISPLQCMGYTCCYWKMRKGDAILSNEKIYRSEYCTASRSSRIYQETRQLVERKSYLSFAVAVQLHWESLRTWWMGVLFIWYPCFSGGEALAVDIVLPPRKITNYLPILGAAAGIL